MAENQVKGYKENATGGYDLIVLNAAGQDIIDGTELSMFATPKAIADAGVTMSSKTGQIAGLTDKATPVDADTLMVEDSAASNAKRKLSWANIKATIKAYFDTIYLSLSGGTITGALELAGNAAIGLKTSLAANTYSGFTIPGIAGTALSFGHLVHLQKSDGKWEKADANVITTATGDVRSLLGICVQAASENAATVILLVGTVSSSLFPTLSVGEVIYPSEAAGTIAFTQPSTASVGIRGIGHALTSTDIFFNPDVFWFTHV